MNASTACRWACSTRIRANPPTSSAPCSIEAIADQHAAAVRNLAARAF